jgi:hypothetical protein
MEPADDKSPAVVNDKAPPVSSGGEKNEDKRAKNGTKTSPGPSVSNRKPLTPGFQQLGEEAAGQDHVHLALMYETTLSTLSDFAYIFNRDGEAVFINQPLLDLWMVKLEDTVGKTVHELPCPDEMAPTLH